MQLCGKFQLLSLSTQFTPFYEYAALLMAHTPYEINSYEINSYEIPFTVRGILNKVAGRKVLKALTFKELACVIKVRFGEWMKVWRKNRA